MARGKRKSKQAKTQTDPVIKQLNNLVCLMQDLLILQLGQNKVPQKEIAKIMGVGMHRVNRLLKPIKKGSKK